VIAPRPRALLGLGVTCAALLALPLIGDLRQRSAVFLVLYAVAAAGYLLVVSAPAALRLRYVVMAALLVRLAFLPTVPSLSDDYHRYIWDGRVQLAGVDPYRHPPSSPLLDRIEYADRDLINHPGVRTIYPPLAEGLFAGVTAFGGGLMAFKVLFGFFELLTAGAVWLLAPRRRRPEALTLYLLCPLVVLETWSSAHLEAAAVFFIVAAAILLLRGRDAWAGAALGLAAALKLTPAFLLIPALVGGRARATRLLPAFIVAFGLPYIPYLLGGGARGSFGSFHPTGNAFGFFLVEQFVPRPAVLFVCGAAAIGGAVLISLRMPGRERVAQTFSWSATVLLLLVPVVHSWYWLAPATLAVAAGIRMPVYLGLAGVAGEAAYTAWPLYRGWLHLLSYLPLLAGIPAIRRWSRGRAGATKGGRADAQRGAGTGAEPGVGTDAQLGAGASAQAGSPAPQARLEARKEEQTSPPTTPGGSSGPAPPHRLGEDGDGVVLPADRAARLPSIVDWRRVGRPTGGTTPDGTAPVPADEDVVDG
jgi:hypothetical protein